MRKKFSSKILLILIMSVFLSSLAIATTYAAGLVITTNNNITYDGDSSYKLVTNTGSFDIAHIGNIGSEVMNVYKIIDVFYNSAQDVLKYQFTSDFKKFLASSSTYRTLTIDDYFKLEKGEAVQGYAGDVTDSELWETSDTIVTGGHLTSNDFAKLMSAYAAFIRTNGTISGISLTTSVGGSHTIFSSSSLAVGSYMALPQSTKYVYAVMVDSIQLQKSSGTWYIKDGKVEAKMENSSIGLSYKYGSSTGSDISVDVGREIVSTVTVKVPVYPADANKDGNLNIYLPSNIFPSLTFTTLNGETTVTNVGEIKDKNNEVVGRIVTSPQGGHEVPTGEIIFYLNKIVGGSSITITYSKTLNDDNNLVIGSAGNTEEIYMTYPSPYGGDTLRDSVTGKLRTYGIEITGTSGAEFDIKSGDQRVGIVVIGKDGKGYIKGLAAGNYVVEQSVAPAGYIKIKDPKTVTVGTGQEVTGKPGYYGVTMVNTIPSLLPFTGGVGTIIFTVSGVLLTIFAIVLFILYKKRKQKEKVSMETL